MATHRLPILGAFTSPDTGGAVFFAPVGSQLTLASADSEPLCVVIPDPAAGGDHGLYGRFCVPKNYSSTPVIVARYIADGAPTADMTVPLGVQVRAIADNEGYDQALDTEDTSSLKIGSNGTGHADEDVVEQSITVTHTFAADDDVVFFFFWDDNVSADLYTGDLLLTGLFFEYSD